MDTATELDVAVKNSFISTKHDGNEVEGRGRTVDLVPWWGRKLAALYIVRIMQGAMNSLIGPTLLDLIEYLSTDMTSLSLVVSLGIVGFITGTILCALLSKRIQPELHLALNMCVVGGAIASSPWGGSLAYFGVFYMIESVTIGFFEPFSSGYPLHLLRNDKRKNPAEQAVHAAWSVGAFIGPLIAGAFLSPQSLREGLNSTEVFNNTTMQTTFYPQMTSLYNTSAFDTNTTKRQMVPFAFLTCGCLAILSTVPAWVIFLIGPRTEIQKKEQKAICRETDKQPKSFKVLVMVLMCFWFGLYLCTEFVPAVYISAFVVKHLGWDKYKGTLVTATMYGAHSLCRILSVLVSVVISPTKMVMGSMGLTLLAYIILVSLHTVHPAFVWFSMALAGSAMSGFYASALVWVAGHIHVTNTETSFMALGSSFGVMFSNFFTAYMFENYSPLWVLYIMLGAVVAQTLVYCLLYIVVRWFKPKPYLQDTLMEFNSRPINK